MFQQGQPFSMSGWWGATTSSNVSSAWRVLWSRALMGRRFSTEGSLWRRAAWPRGTLTISGRVTGPVLEPFQCNARVQV